MNALPEVPAKSPERFYVIEKMTAARNAIQRGCGDLVSNREKVAKFRESNLQRAQDAYLELQKAQKRILSALDDAQLAFREIEEDALADYAGSTTGIMSYAEQSDAKEFIIGTEYSIVQHLQFECPDKVFYALSSDLICQNMKMTTIGDVYRSCLGTGGEEIVMSEELIEAARRPIDRMIELGG